MCWLLMIFVNLSCSWSSQFTDGLACIPWLVTDSRFEKYASEIRLTKVSHRSWRFPISETEKSMKLMRNVSRTCWRKSGMANVFRSANYDDKRLVDMMLRTCNREMKMIVSFFMLCSIQVHQNTSYKLLFRTQKLSMSISLSY